MTIIEKSHEFDKRQIYKMTKDAGIKSMKDVEDNTLLSVTGYVRFEDEGNTITSVCTADHEVYAFQSDTFWKSLNDILNIMCDGDSGNWTEPIDIIKISGETKAGRHYINCKLA